MLGADGSRAGETSRAERVKSRRLTDAEGRLQQIVRRGQHGSIRVRRALIIMASASGTPVPAIARLVAADADTAREVIHAFNDRGLDCLDPNWAGRRPRRITTDDEEFIACDGHDAPTQSGPSLHALKPAQTRRLPRRQPRRRVHISRERLRQILHQHGLRFPGSGQGREATSAALTRSEAGAAPVHP
jgi:transposase